jgi:hypothetical protein
MRFQKDAKGERPYLVPQDRREIRDQAGNRLMLDEQEVAVLE